MMVRLAYTYMPWRAHVANAWLGAHGISAYVEHEQAAHIYGVGPMGMSLYVAEDDVADAELILARACEIEAVPLSVEQEGTTDPSIGHEADSMGSNTPMEREVEPGSPWTPGPWEVLLMSTLLYALMCGELFLRVCTSWILQGSSRVRVHEVLWVGLNWIGEVVILAAFTALVMLPLIELLKAAKRGSSLARLLLGAAAWVIILGKVCSV